jgi:hypothetical protein
MEAEGGKPRHSKRNPVGKVSLKGAGAGRAVATSSFFFGGDFLLSERRFVQEVALEPSHHFACLPMIFCDPEFLPIERS